VAEATIPMTERRGSERSDRRRNPRSGRRAGDPREQWRWRRLAWLFAAYAAYVSVRSLPRSMKKLFQRAPA
jgi:hypothetical protein